MPDELKNWTKENDGTLRLFPSTGGQGAIIAKQIIAVRIDYISPDAPQDHIDKFQFHMTPEHARSLGQWLLEAAAHVERPHAGPTAH